MATFYSIVSLGRFSKKTIKICAVTDFVPGHSNLDSIAVACYLAAVVGKKNRDEEFERSLLGS